MKLQIRGILIDPGHEPVIQKLPCTQMGLQGLIGGEIRCSRFPREFAALMYREPGPANNMPNKVYRGQWYYGRLVIVGWRGDRPVDLPVGLAQTLAERWSRLEVQDAAG